MPDADLRRELIELVAGVAPAAGLAWLATQFPYDRAGFGVAFSGAARRLGQAPVVATQPLRIAWPRTSGADECARAALVLAAVDALPAGEHVAVVRDLIRRGDVRERQAVLRVLAGLPEPARFVAIAVDACRTNVQTVFEAIACDNAFPARHFDDAAFNQLVLKALFVGAPVARIVDLEARITDELVRMVDAYASERRAAGRAVPDDAARVRRSP